MKFTTNKIVFTFLREENDHCIFKKIISTFCTLVNAVIGYLDEMLAAYTAENPGHTMGTRSCFRMTGTSCGRLCAATGESDHHTGLTCDLIDTAYGTELDTDDYAAHPEWQWLKAN